MLHCSIALYAPARYQLALHYLLEMIVNFTRHKENLFVLYSWFIKYINEKFVVAGATTRQLFRRRWFLKNKNTSSIVRFTDRFHVLFILSSIRYAHVTGLVERYLLYCDYHSTRIYFWVSIVAAIVGGSSRCFTIVDMLCLISKLLPKINTMGRFSTLQSLMLHSELLSI